jgi:hypothetical protein
MFGALNARVVRLPATHEIFSDAETRGANLPRAGFDLHNLLFPALAAALFLTDRWFSILDDEANFIVYSSEPVRHTLELYRAGMYHHAHPPLTDIILHFWLALTASRLWLEPTARAQAQLEGRCVLLSDEKLVPDPGYHWKRRRLPRKWAIALARPSADVQVC